MNTRTIQFRDYLEEQGGIIVVRTIEDKVAIAFSLENNGEFEALLDREAVQGVIDALSNAIISS